MRIRTSRTAGIVASLVVASALLVPATASASTVSTETAVASRTVPARDLGPCWAQAGRLIGGFYGSLIATAATPWAAAAAWAAYLGSVSQEKRDKYGNFAC
jgi:hypothetical protein